MRHMLFVLGITLAAIVVGTILYMYGPDELREMPESMTAAAEPVFEEDGIGPVPFTVLSEGVQAISAPVRKNYGVYDIEEFARIWKMAYGEDAPALPAIDFEEEYVIGVFAGEKPSGGHAIAVTRITDASNVRTVEMTLTEPGAGCIASQALTSPFQFVSVPMSGRILERADSVVQTACE